MSEIVDLQYYKKMIQELANSPFTNKKHIEHLFDIITQQEFEWYIIDQPTIVDGIQFFAEFFYKLERVRNLNDLGELLKVYYIDNIKDETCNYFKKDVDEIVKNLNTICVNQIYRVVYHVYLFKNGNTKYPYDITECRRVVWMLLERRNEVNDEKLVNMLYEFKLI